ncbi:MAG: response regulator [Acidobacteriota bacterium]
MGHSLEESNTSTTNAVALLRKGIAAAKAGDKAAARTLLLETLKLNSRAELAWLWLAWIAETPKEAVLYLEKVLEINPNNAQANQWMLKIRQRKAQGVLIWHCPLCAVSLQTKVSKCPKCRSILELTDIEALLNNGDADRSLINQAIERLENYSLNERIDKDSTDESFAFNLHFHLALAYFNLKLPDEGLIHLREASNLTPTDNVLRAQVQVLTRQLTTIREKAWERQRQKIVLVIDDSPTVRKLVAVTLERHGYKVITAADGVQAMAKIEESMPDLILLDITMPYMDGYQVCKVLKNNLSTKQVPVLMLSGKDGFIDKVRARMAGAVGHISKPVDPDTLLAALQKHLKTENKK